MTEEAGKELGVTVSFRTSAWEQARVAREVIRFTWSWWLAMATFVAAPAGMAIWLIAFRGSLWGPAILIVVAVAGAFFWSYAIPWIGIVTTRRGIPEADGPYTWTVAGEGCHLNGPNGSAQLGWKAFVRVRETPEFVLLYLGKSLAQFIPKRAMSSDQLSTLRAVLRRAGFEVGRAAEQ